MRKLFPYFLIGFIVSVIIFAAGYATAIHVVNSKDYGTIYEMEKMPMPDEYRKWTGYDSVTYHYFSGKLEVDFCYPNEWEFYKYRKCDTVYLSARIEAKPKRKHKKEKYGIIYEGDNGDADLWQPDPPIIINGGSVHGYLDTAINGFIDTIPLIYRIDSGQYIAPPKYINGYKKMDSCNCLIDTTKIN